MIQLQQKSENEFNLLINGEVFESAHITREIDRNSGGRFFNIFTRDLKIIDEIGKFTLCDFPPLYILNFPVELTWLNNGINPSIWFIADEHSSERSGENYGKSFEISMNFHTNIIHWRGNYTFAEYYVELEKLIAEDKHFNIEMNDKSGGLEYGFIVEQNEKVVVNSIIKNNLDKFLDSVKKLHYKVEQNLNSVDSKKLLSLSFDFPNELKISCEQYLLYFAQFLQDLGINAASNLNEEAGKVLFSVTPTDDIEALDKIHEALALYLSLPSSPVLYNDSFQSMQLKQQVENLQHSQKMKEMEMRSAQYALRLAQQNIENQDKIITQQNSFIDNQNKIIEKITSESIMIDSLENKEELEKFCEGFEVGKSEFLIKHFGLHLNPATVLKNIGKKFTGKDDDIISILDSDEETDKNN
jgi:hypothetical protein